MILLSWIVIIQLSASRGGDGSTPQQAAFQTVNLCHCLPFTSDTFLCGNVFNNDFNIRCTFCMPQARHADAGNVHVMSAQPCHETPCKASPCIPTPCTPTMWMPTPFIPMSICKHKLYSQCHARRMLCMPKQCNSRLEYSEPKNEAKYAENIGF